MEAAPLDWASPWLRPWREPGRAVERRILAGASVAAALNAQAPAFPVFVPQAALPEGEPYERFIHDRGQCPTRDGLHDFFNGLCWLQLPHTKRTFNQRHAEVIAREGIGARRGPVRDAITVFDENGAVLDAPPPIWEALLARQWQRLFVELRPLWRDCRFLIVGHALLEQLATAPRKPLTAHVWREPCPAGDAAAADDWLAARCTPDVLAAKPFTPLPVLGIPGWWPENENFSFYDDSLVFRPHKKLGAGGACHVGVTAAAGAAPANTPASEPSIPACP